MKRFHYNTLQNLFMNLLVTLKLQWPLEIASTEKKLSKNFKKKLRAVSTVPHLLCVSRLLNYCFEEIRVYILHKVTLHEYIQLYLIKNIPYTCMIYQLLCCLFSIITYTKSFVDYFWFILYTYIYIHT